jgi:hypothetical protein
MSSESGVALMKGRTKTSIFESGNSSRELLNDGFSLSRMILVMKSAAVTVASRHSRPSPQFLANVLNAHHRDFERVFIVERCRFSC